MCFVGGGASLIFTFLTQETLPSLNLETLLLNSTEILKVISGLCQP